MDTLTQSLPEALLALALLAGAGAGLLALRRRMPRDDDSARPQPYVDYAPGVGDDAEVPRDTPLRTVEDVPFGVVSPTPAPVEPPSPPPQADEAAEYAGVVGPDDVEETLAGPDSVEDLLAELENDRLEVPAPSRGRLGRLRERLQRSGGLLGRGVLAVLSRGDLGDADWDEIEESLLMADLGVGPTSELMERLRRRVRAGAVTDAQSARALLREELLSMVDPTMDRSLPAARQGQDGRPAVILVVGVNGTGKTTTTGKLARVLVADGQVVVLGAADTFRAAAADQLQTWGERVGAAVVRGPEGGDPAAVAFEAVDVASAVEADVVVIDTAGRLHTKAGLMDELGKVKRVVERRAAVDEVLLVIDATTGQNGLVQARVFAEAVDVTGLVLTKLDGTAKGGIVVAVQRELGVPVKLVGLGEGPDDLAPFDAEAFVDALLA